MDVTFSRKSGKVFEMKNKNKWIKMKILFQLLNSVINIRNFWKILELLNMPILVIWKELTKLRIYYRAGWGSSGCAAARTTAELRWCRRWRKRRNKEAERCQASAAYPAAASPESAYLNNIVYYFNSIQFNVLEAKRLEGSKHRSVNPLWPH